MFSDEFYLWNNYPWDLTNIPVGQDLTATQVAAIFGAQSANLIGTGSVQRLFQNLSVVGNLKIVLIYDSTTVLKCHVKKDGMTIFHSLSANSCMFEWASTTPYTQLSNLDVGLAYDTIESAYRFNYNISTWTKENDLLNKGLIGTGNTNVSDHKIIKSDGITHEVGRSYAVKDIHNYGDITKIYENPHFGINNKAIQYIAHENLVQTTSAPVAGQFYDGSDSPKNAKNFKIEPIPECQVLAETFTSIEDKTGFSFYWADDVHFVLNNKIYLIPRNQKILLFKRSANPNTNTTVYSNINDAVSMLAYGRGCSYIPEQWNFVGEKIHINGLKPTIDSYEVTRSFTDSISPAYISYNTNFQTRTGINLNTTTYTDQFITQVSLTDTTVTSPSWETINGQATDIWKGNVFSQGFWNKVAIPRDWVCQLDFSTDSSVPLLNFLESEVNFFRNFKLNGNIGMASLNSFYHSGPIGYMDLNFHWDVPWGIIPLIREWGSTTVPLISNDAESINIYKLELYNLKNQLLSVDSGWKSYTCYQAAAPHLSAGYAITLTTSFTSYHNHSWAYALVVVPADL